MNQQADKHIPELLRRWLARRSPDIGAMAVITGFFLLSFGRYLAERQFLIGGDVFFYTYPLRTMAWQIISSGSLPLWTPNVLSGYPLLAMSQLGLAYPITWAHLFLPSHVAEQIYVLVPFLLAPTFTYAYVREINGSRMAALIAGLAFGYGGLMTNTYGMNAIPTNALMWLPLMLIAIERARTRRLIPCLIAGSLIASLSLLTGHPASTLQVAVISIAYAGLSSLGLVNRSNRNGSTKLTRWQPVVVGAGSFLFATGIAAFQVLETMRAVRRSIRDTLTYDFFVAGSLTPIEFVRSFLVPLNHFTEVTSFVPPMVLALAIVAVVKHRSSDRRVLFWAVVAAMGMILMLGKNGLVYSLLYHVPIFNLFRRPSRYAFEWTFGISVLAGVGYDTIVRGWDQRKELTQRVQSINWLGMVGLVACTLIAIIWGSAVRYGASDLKYLTWKLVFTIATTAVFWFCWRVSRTHSSAATLMVLICFVEPFILISVWWPGTAKSAARLQMPSLTTSWLQRFQPTEGRVYVRTNGPEEERRNPPRFDALDRTAMFGLQNTGGYEPLFPERYSRALGGVTFDSLNPRSGFQATEELFELRSHVLDLLNTAFVVKWADVANEKPRSIEHSGRHYAERDIGKEIKPHESFRLQATSIAADSLALVTSLANSADLPQETEIARLQVVATDGQTMNLSLRAGVDSAEWAHERPDIRPNIRHRLAPIFDKTSADSSGSYSALRYETRLPLGKSTPIDHIVITNTTSSASIALWKATLFDSSTLRSIPLTNKLGSTQLDAERWELGAEFDGVVVLRNKRALPRVWLTHEAEAVDGEAALEAIQGRGPRQFDPKKTALLEVNPDELPQLEAALENSIESARVISYEPTRIAIETNSITSSVLVTSEVFYPGWAATIDGQPVPILLADYLLRAISLPAGKHQVVMQYTAPAARNGAIISVMTLGVLGLMLLYSIRRRKPT